MSLLLALSTKGASQFQGQQGSVEKDQVAANRVIAHQDLKPPALTPDAAAASDARTGVGSLGYGRDDQDLYIFKSPGGWTPVGGNNPTYYKRAYTVVETDANAVYTAEAVVKGLIERSGTTVIRTDTLPSAAALVAEMEASGITVGTTPPGNDANKEGFLQFTVDNSLNLFPLTLALGTNGQWNDAAASPANGRDIVLANGSATFAIRVQRDVGGANPNYLVWRIAEVAYTGSSLSLPVLTLNAMNFPDIVSWGLAIAPGSRDSVGTFTGDSGVPVFTPAPSADWFFRIEYITPLARPPKAIIITKSIHDPQTVSNLTYPLFTAYLPGGPDESLLWFNVFLTQDLTALQGSQSLAHDWKLIFD